MQLTTFLWLVLAGIGGGLTGSIAGLASLVTYPALLAVGLSARAANVTNTVSLVFNSVGSIHGSKPELSGHDSETRTLGLIAIVGGTSGAILLLSTPGYLFTWLAPILVALGSLAILLGNRKLSPSNHRTSIWQARVAIFAVTVYEGYFGAAAGVLLLAAISFTRIDSFPRLNALKNLLSGLANAVAALIFTIEGVVHWLSVIPLATGALFGGLLGPIVVRHTHARPLRILISVAGLGLAVHLAIGVF